MHLLSRGFRCEGLRSPRQRRDVGCGVVTVKHKIEILGAGGGTRTPTGSFGPTDFLATSAFAAADGRRSWSGLSLHRSDCRRCCPSSLYTFPRGLGSGLPHWRFPRIWAGLHPGFPARALKSVAQVRCVYQFRHARATISYSTGSDSCQLKALRAIIALFPRRHEEVVEILRIIPCPDPGRNRPVDGLLESFIIGRRE